MLGQPVDNILIGVDFLISALEATRDEKVVRDIELISLHHRNGQPFPANLQTIPVSDGKKLTDGAQHQVGVCGPHLTDKFLRGISKGSQQHPIRQAQALSLPGEPLLRGAQRRHPDL